MRYALKTVWQQQPRQQSNIGFFYPVRPPSFGSNLEQEPKLYIPSNGLVFGRLAFTSIKTWNLMQYSNPNVTREVIRYENFVVIIPVLIKLLNLEKKI